MSISKITETDREIRILERALDLAQAEPRHKWSTWDVFAGRTVEHEEGNESFLRRILNMATEQIDSNVTGQQRN